MAEKRWNDTKLQDVFTSFRRQKRWDEEILLGEKIGNYCAHEIEQRSTTSTALHDHRLDNCFSNNHINNNAACNNNNNIDNNDKSVIMCKSLTSQNIRDCNNLRDDEEAVESSPYLSVINCVKGKRGSIMETVNNFSNKQNNSDDSSNSNSSKNNHSIKDKTTQLTNLNENQNQRIIGNVNSFSQPQPSMTTMNHNHQSRKRQSSITIINHNHQSQPSITTINHNQKIRKDSILSQTNDDIDNDRRLEQLNELNCFESGNPMVDVHDNVVRAIKSINIENFNIQIFDRHFSACCPTSVSTNTEFFQYLNGDRTTPKKSECLHYNPKGFQISNVDTTGRNEANFISVMTSMVQDVPNMKITLKKQPPTTNAREKQINLENEMKSLQNKIYSKCFYKPRMEHEKEFNKEESEEMKDFDDMADKETELLFNEHKHKISRKFEDDVYNLKHIIHNLGWEIGAISSIERMKGLCFCVYVFFMYVFVCMFLYVCFCMYVFFMYVFVCMFFLCMFLYVCLYRQFV